MAGWGGSYRWVAGYSIVDGEPCVEKTTEGALAPTRRRRRVFWVALALLTLALAWLQLELTEFAEDDAFIHFRIGRNFAEYGVPYFNLDQPLKGSSSTVWLLVVSGVTWAFQDPVPVIALLNLALVFACSWLVARLHARLFPESAAWLRIAVAVGAFVILWPTGRGLMESVLAVVLLVGAYLAIDSDLRLGWLVFGVAVATRPELILAVLPAVWLWARMQPRSLRSWIEAVSLGLCGVVPFVIFDIVAYGTLIPHAVAAKRLMYDLSVRQSLASLIPMLGAGGAIVILAGAVGVRLARSRSGSRRTSMADALIVSGVLVAAAYAGSRTLVFPWYQPLWLVPLFLGVVWKGMAVHARIGRWAGLLIGLPAAAYCFVLALALTGQIQVPLASFQARTPMYQAIGGALSESCDGCTLASSEIGGLAYAFEGTVLDAGGLTDPDALGHHPLLFPSQRHSGGLGAIPIGYVLEKKPDMIVSYEPLLERQMLDTLNGYQVLECRPVLPRHESRGFPAAVMGSEHLYVFISDTLSNLVRSDVLARTYRVGGCVRYLQTA